MAAAIGCTTGSSGSSASNASCQQRWHGSSTIRSNAFKTAAASQRGTSTSCHDARHRELRNRAADGGGLRESEIRRSGELPAHAALLRRMRASRHVLTAADGGKARPPNSASDDHASPSLFGVPEASGLHRDHGWRPHRQTPNVARRPGALTPLRGCFERSELDRRSD